MGRVLENVSVVFRWGSILSLLPFHNVKTRRIETKKLYSGTVGSLIAFWTIYATCVKFLYDLEENSEDIVLYGMPPVLTAMANLAVIYETNFHNFRVFQLLFEKFDRIDANLKLVRVSKFTSVRFWLINGLMIVKMISDQAEAIIFGYGDQTYYTYFYHDRFHLYLTFIIVLFQRSILSCLKDRMDAFNGVVKALDLDCVKKIEMARYRVNNLIKVHNEICDLVDIFNRLFGWNVLFTMLQTFLGVLGLINLYTIASLTWSDSLVSILWNLYITGQSVLIAKSCETVQNAATKTITLAYKAVHRHSQNPEMRDKLFILAQQAFARRAQFTAAGFFGVNHSMLFTFVNMITTYIVVIIQFNSFENF